MNMVIPENGPLKHLHKVVNALAYFDYSNPLAAFESTSVLIREGKINENSKKEDSTVTPKIIPGGPCISTEADFDYIEKFELLRRAGVECFSGPVESFSVARQLSVLKKANPNLETSFWGKILTTGQECYYIAKVSGKNISPELDSDTAKYFCSYGYEKSEWIELVLPTVEQLGFAKRFGRLLFSGNMQRVIKSHPPFRGNELDYLSATVRTISDCCDVYPASVDYDIADEIVPSIHCYHNIGLNRFCHRNKKLLERDTKSNWRIRYIGDPNTYIDEKHCNEYVSHGMVRIDCLNWHGFSFIVHGTLKKYMHVYVGNGVSNEHSSQFITDYPPSIQPEYLADRNSEYVCERHEIVDAPIKENVSEDTVQEQATPSAENESK